MKAKLIQLTSVGGHDVFVASNATQQEFKRLGGKVGLVTDKTVELIFPSPEAAMEFKTFAKITDRAMFE